MSTFKLVLTETRPDVNVQFYSYTEEDNQVFNDLPFFVSKSETLSEDSLNLTKTWCYDYSYPEMEDLLYLDENLNELNIKVATYCSDNGITRGTLTAYINLEGEDILFKTFSEKL